MNITRSEALFLYSALFASDAKGSFCGDAQEKSYILMDKLESFILSGDTGEDMTSHHDMQEEADDDVEDADSESIEHDDHISTDELTELPKIQLSGSDSSLHFEENVEDEIDAVVGDEETVIENVQCIHRPDKKTVKILSSGEWTSFKARRLPKEWLDSLSEGLVYLVSNSSECDQ